MIHAVSIAVTTINAAIAAVATMVTAPIVKTAAVTPIAAKATADTVIEKVNDVPEVY